MGLNDDKEFVFHALRHTCATRMVDAKIELLAIKKWLGHKRVETTERYAHVKPQILIDAMNRVQGLDRLAA
jgi:integrase